MSIIKSGLKAWKNMKEMLIWIMIKDMIIIIIICKIKLYKIIKYNLKNTFKINKNFNISG